VKRAAPLLAAVVLALASCSVTTQTDEMDAEQGTATPDEPAASHGEHSGEASTDAPENTVPLRAGERFVDVAMPEPYRPSSPTPGSTDDYRCFLLDPSLDDPAFVTGVDVLPGHEELVHHVILFQVPPESVAAAEQQDAAEPGQGWTCFGGSGLDQLAGASFDSAPWVAAWAPGGGEQVFGEGFGIPLAAGSRVIMQVHYNLLVGDGEDVSSARLRLASESTGLAALHTQLLFAPVELPCRPGRHGPLCNRAAAVRDVTHRFGARSGQIVAGLQLFCGGDMADPKAGPVQSCDRPVRKASTVRAVAGHMHLLGRSVRIELNPGRPDARTLLDVPVWDFDDQGARVLRPPAEVKPGDTVRLTCRHDQRLRDLLPAFEGQPERYVVWGEGTTDEMCLGILMTTDPA
jgi:Copper type II ascorbate-dependent monooxygenase, N-terminal domain